MYDRLRIRHDVLTPRGAGGAVLLAAGLLVAGCGEVSASPQEPQTRIGTDIETLISRSGFVCKVMEGPKAPAIDCDFTHLEGPQATDPTTHNGTVVQEITTPDNTLCVVIDNAGGSDLDCMPRSPIIVT